MTRTLFALPQNAHTRKLRWIIFAICVYRIIYSFSQSNRSNSSSIKKRDMNSSSHSVVGFVRVRVCKMRTAKIYKNMPDEWESRRAARLSEIYTWLNFNVNFLKSMNFRHEFRYDAYFFYALALPFHRFSFCGFHITIIILCCKWMIRCKVIVNTFRAHRRRLTQFYSVYSSRRFRYQIKSEHLLHTQSWN